MTMLIIDTTVLAYAVGGEHDLRGGARDFLRGVAEGRIRASTTPEVIQEFAHVRSRRTTRADAASQALDFATMLSPLITTSQDDIERGLGLWEHQMPLGSFDAILIAAAERVGASAVVSSDKGFADQHLLPHLTIAQALATLA
ncbi:MAG: PIN domain-containing protein [Actinobacteria bacterium]|nr:PIN domain-containing protein [Actinomycetota bacterium]